MKDQKHKLLRYVTAYVVVMGLVLVFLLLLGEVI